MTHEDAIKAIRGIIEAVEIPSETAKRVKRILERQEEIEWLGSKADEEPAPVPHILFTDDLVEALAYFIFMTDTGEDASSWPNEDYDDRARRQLNDWHRAGIIKLCEPEPTRYIVERKDSDNTWKFWGTYSLIDAKRCADLLTKSHARIRPLHATIQENDDE